MRETIASPSPEPARLVEKPASNSRERSSGRIPEPVSATCRWIVPTDASSRVETETLRGPAPASSIAATALSIRFRITRRICWRSRSSIGTAGSSAAVNSIVALPR